MTDNLKKNAENFKATEGSKSAVERFVIFFWDGLGKAGIFVVAMIVILITEFIYGFTDRGTIAIIICLFAYILASIKDSLELISRKLDK